MGPFLETLFGGLMTGMLYSLVALGFVLIYKASGVFNFAQGAMVFFAALTFVGLQQDYGINFWVAFVLALGAMILLGLATEKFVLRPLVNQPQITLFMATIGLTFFIEGLAQLLGGALPEEARIPMGYTGPPRIVVPTVRTSADEGEMLKLRVVLLGSLDPAGAKLSWRLLGKGDFRTLPLRPVGRNVYEVELPEAAADFEYYLEAGSGAGLVRFPATAPVLNQTVVVIPKL